MRLPPSVVEAFRRQGRRGGQERARRLSADERSAIARIAATRRWTRVRFGEARFEDLGLPGGRMVDQGLADLARRIVSPESLVVSLAAPRLRREGVPVPPRTESEGDIRLYRLLESRDAGMAHARYLAHLGEILSFANACGRVRKKKASP